MTELLKNNGEESGIKRMKENAEEVVFPLLGSKTFL